MTTTNLRRKPKIVRMYPRIASLSTAKSRASRSCKEKSATPAPRKEQSAPATRADLRLRLLKMIVDNERARRQEPHAS